MPLVMVGQAAGSTAMIFVFLPYLMFWPRNGKEMPAKLEPPPSLPHTLGRFFIASLIFSSGYA